MSDARKLSYEQKKVLVLSSLGGVLEFYDFIIYIFLANILEKLFFASSSEFVSSLKTFAVFSIGYLIRPLGGILFSHFGDRYGRKVVFYLTILLMAVPSFGIALLPTNEQIGIAAPILLLLLRMMQGLALGGELPASITFVSEHVNKNQIGIGTASLFFGVNIGLLLGSLTTTILTTYVSTPALYSYGWRIPFLLGGVFGIVAIFLRRYLKETAAFSELRQHEKHRIPAVVVLKDFWREVIQGSILVSLVALTVFLYLYWPHYLAQYMYYDHDLVLKINTFATVILSGSILFSGWLTDRFGARLIYQTGALLIILITYPLYVLMGMHQSFTVLIAYGIFSVLFGSITGTFAAILSQLFKTSVRYSGVAVCYNLAYAIVGGLSPLICILSIHYFNNIFAPAYYLILIAAMGFLACVWGRLRFGMELQEVEV